MSINDLLNAEWLIPLLIIFCLGFFIAIPFITSKKEKETFGSEDTTIEMKQELATIVEKNKETNYLTKSIEIDHIVFEFEDGNRINLAVKDASTMVVGDRGTLSYQGKKFVSFDRIR